MRTTQQLFDLKGKTALITGGSRGLGLQIAEALGEQGATLVLSSRKQEALEAAAAGMAGDVAVYAANAGDIEAADACVAATIERFGGLDILFVNAGLADFRPLAQWDEAGFDRSVAVNL